MSKKLIYLVSFVLLLGLTNMVSAQIVEGFESGGFSTFNWEHEGDALWWITTTEANGGRHSAQAGDIEDDQTSTLKLTHGSEQAGSISFFVKTSSEAGWDQLFFRINGHEMDSWSGESEWTEVSYPVEAGSHTYTWSYEKDSSASDGEDTAWIDDITLPHAPTRNWVLIWSDEFDCNGLPDPNRWSYDVWGPGYVNEELQAYTYARSENARVEDGYLIITAIEEAYQGAQYTSARLKTLGLGDWIYGKIEVRAQLPTGRGLWPAIWMLPSDSVYGGWPASGEIDIMENVGFQPDKIHWTVHTEKYNAMKGTHKGASKRFSAPYNQFYTYGLEWSPDRLIFLVDNVPYFTFHRESDDYQVWPFDHPFHLILNIAVGGTWGGAQGIDASVFPQEMLVDYVRIYRLDEQAGPYTLDIVNLSNGVGFKTPDQETYEPGSMPHLSVEPYPGFEFKRWHGTIQSPDPNLVLYMCFDHTQIPEFTRPGEMLTNSQFLSGTRAWAYYGATVSGAEGELHIRIPSTTPDPWSIQVSQGNIELEEGRSYTLYVTACAARNRTINAVVGLDEEPWTVYAQRTLNLTARPQTFDVPFTMNTDQPKGRVALDVGRSLGDVYIQEVRLNTSPQQDFIPRLDNGGFEDGVMDPWTTYGGVTTEVVQEDPVEGYYCLHLDVAAAGANFWDVGLQHRGHNVFEQGKKYTLSAFLKCSGDALDINFKPEHDGDPWTGYGEQSFTMTEEWQEFSITTPVFAADVNPAAITFHIGYAAADFWIDGVRFYEGDYVPPVLGDRGSARGPNPADGAIHEDTSVNLINGMNGKLRKGCF